MNKEYFKVIFPLVIALAAIPACSSTRQVDPIPDAEAQSTDQNMARENHASYYTELSFDHGSALLSDSDRTALQDLIRRSMNHGEVDQVTIVSWADMDYPTEGKHKLPASQKKLADARNERIKQFLKATYPSLEVSTINMAKRPNAVQELFKTADARTKQSFENAGIATTEADMNPPAKTSKSLVLSMMKK